jgi:hypothetical protein
MKTKTRNWFFVILVVLIVCGSGKFIRNITTGAFSQTNIEAPREISSSSYRKELESAKYYARSGFHADAMEEALIKAKWDAKEKGVDISGEMKKIYVRGARSIIEHSLMNALFGRPGSAISNMDTYRRFCLNAEIKPDEEKITEVLKIVERQRN